MNLRRRSAAVLTGLALAMGASFGLASPASAAYAPTPVGPSWTPDGAVLAVAVSGGTVFVGGAFTGGVAALNATSGALVWRGDANGAVRALAVSSDGSLLIGGAFSQIGGDTHRKLARLSTSSGAVDHKWKASAAGLVRDVVVVGGTAYIGGAFTKYNGIAQGRLGAVDVTTGKAVTAFTATADAEVDALATDGSRLFIGGKFTAINGQPRNQLASVNVGNNTLDAWKPNPGCPNTDPAAGTGCNVYWDLTLGGGILYAANRNPGAVSAVDTVSGNQRWRVAANGDAQAVTLAPDGLLYVGGHFATIANQSRKILAALDPSNGAVQNFSANFVTSYPGIWALAATSTRLYVGGYFTAAGPTPPKRYPYFAMFG